MSIYADLIPKIKQPTNAPTQAQNTVQQSKVPQQSNNSFADLIPVKASTPVTPSSQPSFLQNLGNGIKNVASQIGQGAQNLFNDLVPNAQPKQNTSAPTTTPPALPIPNTPIQSTIVPDLSIAPSAGQSAIQPNSIENRQKAQQVVDSFTKTNNAIAGFLPETTQTFKDLNIDPLSLKTNPTKPFIDAANTVISAINNTAQAGQALAIALKSGNPSQIAGAAAKGITSVASGGFSPISALFSAANDVPVIGTLTKLLTLPLATLPGDVGKSTVNAVIDQIPNNIANKAAKNNLKAGFGDLGSLVAQIATGAITEVGASKLGVLENKYGSQDAQTIASQAESIGQQAAAQNKTIPSKVVLPPETVQQMANHPGIATTPAAQTLQTFVDQANRTKENVINSRQPQAPVTPQHIEITQGDAIKPGYVTSQAPNGSPFSVKLVDAPGNEAQSVDTTPPTTRQIIKLDKTKYTGMQGGSVIVRPNGIASLDLHFVKEAQGLGQGTRAVAELENIARAKGAKQMQIAAFTQAKGFWEKQGYTEMKDATPTKSSLLVKMQKTLDPNQEFVGMQKTLLPTKENSGSSQIPLSQTEAPVINDLTPQPKTPKVLTGNEVNAIRSTISDKLSQVRETANSGADFGNGIDAIVKSTTDKAGNDKQVLSALRTELAKELNTIGGGGSYKDQYRTIQAIKQEDPEMGPVVEKLQGHIADIDQKLLTSKKELTPTIKEPLETKGAGETKTSKLATGVEEKAVEAKLTSSISKLPEYNRLNMKDQAKDAVAFLNENPEKAMNVALGKEAAPLHVTPEAIFTAIENRALENRDIDTVRQLARSQLSTEATAMGQRIRTLGERNPDSPVTKIKEVKEAREKAATTTPEKIVKEIKATVPKVDKYNWNSFLDSIQC